MPAPSGLRRILIDVKRGLSSGTRWITIGGAN